MNLVGIAHPEHPDRELVDLLFFPTGGGKTEAYLGFAEKVIKKQDQDWSVIQASPKYKFLFFLIG
ncbi:hypothetical protein H6G81_34570 [Scytonema hofmannii FACHB-248]|uniref:Helicase/UvrB N-terminal domain-containing protein n=1 Tax=Scytonema hofmannii FACHB-248 TaxID=1842502 RepID=A0ABR8H0Y2_9CYAN|nr:hypothetical protein [Scytonema hofmannii]MBD2609480.1 hypothetical protein [Scytonema hofmannii FACHB-248]